MLIVCFVTFSHIMSSLWHIIPILVCLYLTFECNFSVNDQVVSLLMLMNTSPCNL